MQSIGNEFLTRYSQGLITADAKLMASLFHRGLSYIVNDVPREGAQSPSESSTWDFIFSKIEFVQAEASHVIEVHPGHLFYHECLVVKNKHTGEIKEGHFGDEAVINRAGKMLLVNRVADSAYFEWFGASLAD